jgi:hypothetical protein
MLSAVIQARHSYGAMLLAKQLPDQRSVHLGPLVLETNLLKNQRLQEIGDQPVLRYIYAEVHNLHVYSLVHMCLDYILFFPIARIQNTNV